MKKIYKIAFSLIFIVFIFISFLKYQNSQNVIKKDDDRYLASEKEKIKSFWKIYRQANQQRINGQLEDAVEGYKNALNFNEKHEDTYYYLGNVYFDLGEYSKAENYWNMLIKINPKSSRSYFQLGNLYLNLVNENYFDLSKAEQYFQMVLNINEEESGSIYYMGQIALIQGNYKKARQIFDAISGTDSKNINASFFNGFIDWKNGDLEEAILNMTLTIQASESEKTAKEVSSEGDTKSGKPLYSSQSPGRKSLFSDHLHDLSDITQPIDPTHLELRYNRLNKYLTQLRANF